MKLIVGLGNPGPKYQLTRHNIGFLLVDALVETRERGQRSYKNEFKAETQRLTIAGEQVLVCKPQTFMNLSGESVQAIMGFYALAPADLIVVQDEVDIPFGGMRFQQKRGHGGHNGIRNIHQMLGTDDYARLRVGVGRPPVATQEVHEWVLSNFSKVEQTRLPEFLDLCMTGLEVWVKQGMGQASTQFNSRTIQRANEG